MNALTDHATRTAVSVSGLRKAITPRTAPASLRRSTMVRILSTLIPADAGTANDVGHKNRKQPAADPGIAQLIATSTGSSSPAWDRLKEIASERREGAPT